MEIPTPPGLFLNNGPVHVPLRAIGPNVLDDRGQMVATCPNSSLADLVAYTINVAMQVHPR